MINNKYILIVEDDFDLLWLIKKILMMNGFQVLTAVTGEEALEQFSRNYFEIQAVILDLSLPDYNGKYLFQEFRKVSREIPVIITTGLEDTEQKKELELLGINGYLIKPFDIMRLVQLLSRVL